MTATLGLLARTVATCVAACGAACGSSDPVPPDAPPPTPDPRFEALRAFVAEELRTSNVPGASLAVVIDGELALSGGLGAKVRGGLEAPDGDTLFVIHSITKTFTAATAVALANEGVLALDAPLTRYVPYLRFQPGSDPSTISVAHLLAHTSGFRELSGVTYPDVPAPEFNRELFRRNDRFALVAPPDQTWSYSNAGYELVGVAIEEAAGASYDALATSRVLEAAGMTTATYDHVVAQERDHAVGHMQPWEPAMGDHEILVEPRDVGPNPINVAVGGLYASANDLAHFAEHLLSDDGGFLGRAGVDAMTTPRIAQRDGYGTSYGNGLQTTVLVGGMRIVGHSGGGGAFAANLVMVPERKFAVAVLLNGDSYQDDINKIPFEAIRLFLGEPARFELQPVGPLSRYLGTYDDPVGLGTMTVRATPTRLALDLPEGTVSLTPIAGDAFYFESPASAPYARDYPFLIVTFFPGDEHEANYAVTALGAGTRRP